MSEAVGCRCITRKVRLRRVRQLVLDPAWKYDNHVVVETSGCGGLGWFLWKLAAALDQCILPLGHHDRHPVARSTAAAQRRIRGPYGISSGCPVLHRCVLRSDPLNNPKHTHYRVSNLARSAIVLVRCPTVGSLILVQHVERHHHLLQWLTSARDLAQE